MSKQQFDVLVDLDVTSPLRKVEDISEAYKQFKEEDAEILITASPARKNPYFNMVKYNTDGTVGFVNPPQSAITHRQKTPVVFDMATVCYVARSDFVMTHNAIFEGRVRAVHIPRERAIDIDTLFDFQMAEYFLNKREQNL